MRSTIRLYAIGMLTMALIAPVGFATRAQAQDHRDERRENERRDNVKRYHDARHNDEHEWNSREDQAYRIWARENHHKYKDFDRLNRRDQENYWNWRHDHSDAQLKIEIR